MTASARVYLASDIHLGATPSRQEQAFMAWLEHAAGDAGRIIVNGDLFDFWFEYLWGTTRGHDRTLDCLRAIVDSGVPITLMGGNHDWWAGRFLRDDVGLEVLKRPVVRAIAGLRTFLAHGDGLGNGDMGYRMLKPILRALPSRCAFALLPPALGDRLAGGASRTEARWSAPNERQRRRSVALEEWAVSKLDAEPDLELIVLGHTHVPLFREVAPGRWYVNAGDWVFHRTYLVLDEGKPPELVGWEGGAEW